MKHLHGNVWGEISRKPIVGVIYNPLRNFWRVIKWYTPKILKQFQLLFEGGIERYKKPKNREKNLPKPQNRNKFWQKPKTEINPH